MSRVSLRRGTFSVSVKSSLLTFSSAGDKLSPNWHRRRRNRKVACRERPVWWEGLTQDGGCTTPEPPARSGPGPPVIEVTSALRGELGWNRGAYHYASPLEIIRGEAFCFTPNKAPLEKGGGPREAWRGVLPKCCSGLKETPSHRLRRCHVSPVGSVGDRRVPLAHIAPLFKGAKKEEHHNVRRKSVHL